MIESLIVINAVLRVVKVTTGIQNAVNSHFWHLRGLELLSGNDRVLKCIHMNSNYDMKFKKHTMKSLGSINIVLRVKNETAGIHNNVVILLKPMIQ